MTLKLIKRVLLAVLVVILLSASSSATTLSSNIGIAAGDDLTALSKDQHKLDTYFQNLTRLGVTWVRWDIEWRVVQEYDSESYNWTAPDKVAKTAQKYGINSLIIIDLPPRWAVEEGSYDEQNISPPQDFEAFAYFAKQVALRYKDSTYGPIEYFEIWNEPNLGGNWYPSSNATEYADLLKQSYTAIKEANPNATVMSGGLGMASSNGIDIDPIKYINSLYEAGAHGYFDAMALHPYTYPAAPNSEINWNNWKSIDLCREIMVNHGDSAKKIWITEYGAPTYGPGIKYEIWLTDYTDNGVNFIYGDYMSEDAQKTMIKQAIEYCNNTDNNVEMLFIYTLDDLQDSPDKVSTENHFGLIRENGTKKPAYGVIKNTSNPLDYPPVFAAIGNKTVNVNSLLSFTISAADPDGDKVTYSATGLPLGAKLNSTTGKFTWTPTATDKYSVKFIATSNGQTDDETIGITVTTATGNSVSYTPTYDNRLRESSPTSVLSTTTYLDVGKSTSSSRDVMLFDLSSYKTTDTISKATLSLYWYYPTGATRTSNTVVEIYRPVEWDPKYVSWRYRTSGVLWSTAGGSWFDKNAVSQGTTPYASITFAGSKVPDNKYYDFDVTQLVQEYVSGKYKNTGFFLKAKTESGNYIAFYSSDWSNTAHKPKLTVTTTSGSLGKPPVLAAIGNKTVNVNSPLSFTISAADPNGDKVTYSATGLPTGAKLDATTGLFTWTPTATEKYSVKFIATANGQTDDETIWITVTTATGSSVSYTPIYDNRLRESSPTSVLSTTTYLDVGKSTSSSRDVMLFDLSSYKTTDTISKATLSLYWYYPTGATRTSDTVVEIYRPVEWDPKYVSWRYRASGVLWSKAGGSWFDKNAVSQGTTPYASVTFSASTVPGNKYYEFDVTQLVKDYISGKYKNTGFFIKAKTESGNYIAFYSSEWTNAAQKPKLTVTR